MRNLYNFLPIYIAMNDTLKIKNKVSFHDLKTILYYFPDNFTFKADITVFHQYFSAYNLSDLKRGFHVLSEHEHQVLSKQELSNVYSIDPLFKETFKPHKGDLGLNLEDISREIWEELKRKRKIFKK